MPLFYTGATPLGSYMRLVIVIFYLLTVALTATAQRSVTEYTPAQRAALQEFISKNPGYQFIPETWVEEDTLRAARIE